MELLLLLTALFASLTGTGSADRALRQVQGVAVVQAVQAAEAAARPSRSAIPAVPTSRPVDVRRAPWPTEASAPLATTHLPFERRLE